MQQPHGGKLVCRTAKGPMEDAVTLPRIQASREVLEDLENIAYGVFSPLEGFLCRADYDSVLKEGRLESGIPWTIPIVLDTDENTAREGDMVAISDGGKIYALMEIEDVYRFDREEYAEKVYGTTDKKHPGVKKLYSLKRYFLGGRIQLLGEPENKFREYTFRPADTRELFKEKGWKTVAGFQTRNIPHRGHEFLQETALKSVDGIYINPLTGTKKPGDFRDETIIQTYDRLVKNHYLTDRCLLAVLRTGMRYAGPREAVFHAIIRKNFGCTHFIVGRDHAGVGNYYPPYAAHEIFAEFPDLGITPLFFRSLFHCRECGSAATEETCAHPPENRLAYSGTLIRNCISRGERPPEEIMRAEIAEMILDGKDHFIR